MTTYFGKPAFCAYGNGNTKTAGVCNGDHMKTHNVNPHSGGNKPEFSQVHGRALLGGTVQIRGPAARTSAKKTKSRKPVPPRVAPGRALRPSTNEVDPRKTQPVLPQTFKEAQARELAILPPKFTEKNLQHKRGKQDNSLLVIKSPTSSSKAAATMQSKPKSRPSHPVSVAASSSKAASGNGGSPGQHSQ